MVEKCILEWLGSIPSHWDIQKGKFVFKQRNSKGNSKNLELLSPTQKYGVIPQMKYEELTGMGAVKLNDKIDLNGLKTICKGDYCISLRSFQGGFEYSQYEGVVSPAYQVFYATIPINEGYYRYLFKDKCFIDKMNSYTMSLRDGKNISFTDFGNTYLPVPPLDEQNRIAEFLDDRCAEIDAISSEIQEQINTLEEYKKSLIKELLDNYLNTNKHIYSKLWHLSKLVTKQTGFDYSNIIQPSLVGELTENTIPYLQTRHFKDNYFNFDTEYYVPKSVARLFPQITLNKKCLLFSIVGASIGNVAIFPATQEAFLGGAVCKVDLINEQLYDYIKHYMMSIYGQEQILTKINASAQGTITVQNVRDFKIPIFENEQVYLEFSNKANKISSYVYSAIADKQKQLETLEEYKKTLIYEYVTGKKEVA